MNVQVLIDAIVRQTTVLIAQLATSGGARAPLAHVANQVFLDLALEIERQGVSRKVSADMFGMALRAYLKKIRRLSESNTERGHSLWEAVLHYLRDHEMATRREVVSHFARDDDGLVKSVLFDLSESGLVFRSGSGDGTSFRVVSDEEQHRIPRAEDDGVDELIWAIVYREGPFSFAQLETCSQLSQEGLARALDRLLENQRLEKDGDRYVAKTFFIPLGQQIGWESAVFDHYQAVVKTICRRLRHDDGGVLTPASGSTYSFDVWSEHPDAGEVRALLDEFVAAVPARRHREQGWPSNAYSVSKAGLNVFTRLLAREQPGLRVNSVCPGWVRTEMGGSGAPRSVEQGAAGVVWAATLSGEGPTGGFFRDTRPIEW